jgi:hypothetical protein
MKIFSSTLLGLLLFFAIAGSGAVKSRRTITVLTEREHWRVVPYTGYQGLKKKKPVTHVDAPSPVPPSDK